MSMATSNPKEQANSSSSGKSSFTKLFGSKSSVQSTGQSEEDLVTPTRSSQEDEKFDIIVGELEDTLMDDAFVRLQTSFFAKHAAIFTEDEENKLEYTTIFNEYTKTIEEYLTKRLKARLPWFSMSEFMQMIKNRPDQAEGDVFDLLQGLGDFAEFKDLILNYKREQEGRNLDLSSLLAVTSTAHH